MTDTITLLEADFREFELAEPAGLLDRHRFESELDSRSKTRGFEIDARFGDQ